MAPKPRPQPELYTPSDAHVALAFALIKTKPPGVSARDYILQLRSRVRRNSASFQESDDRHYLDLVAYWKEQCQRLQDEYDRLRSETIKLERSNHMLTNHTSCTSDMIPSNAMNTSKRKAPAAASTRTVKRNKGTLQPKQSVAETQEAIDDDFDFLDGLGQVTEGASLTETLFTTHKLCRMTSPNAEMLCSTLVQASKALGKVIRLVAHRHGQLSRQSRQTLGPTSLDQDRSNFALAMTVCARAFMSVLVGLSKLTDSNHDQRLASLVVCEMASMFKTILVSVESVACQTAQQVSLQGAEPKKSKDKTSAKPIRESVPARALAHLLIGFLGFLDKTNPIHQQVFDGFVYLLLERVGQRLFYCTFGRHRSSRVEEDIEPLLQPQSPEDAAKRESEALGTRFEVKALVLVLERAMGLVPNHMNPQLSNPGKNQKKVGRALSLRNLPTISKARLSPVAKDRLQRTLITCMYGEKVDDEFLDVLTKPVPPTKLGSLQNVARIEDKDVEDWYKKEVWRLVGWDILAKESGW